MRSPILTLLLSSAFAAHLCACAGDEIAETEAKPEGPSYDEEVASAVELTERPCKEDSFLSYENFGGPFIVTWCNGCHSSALAEDMRAGAPLGIDFDDVALTRQHAERIWVRAGDHNVTMPPAGDPDPLEREMLGEWLACGALTDTELEQLEQ